jgi:protease I
VAKVAFIMDSLFEDSEFRVPYELVTEAGHEPVIVGLEANKKIEGKKGKESITTDVAIGDVSADDFAAVIIPGGYSPDLIRTNDKMVGLVRDNYEAGRPTAAVCHAGWLLAEAGILSGKTVTSWPSIRTDLVNAGANWVDQEVAEDGNIITSRKPDDLEAFSTTILVQMEQQS